MIGLNHREVATLPAKRWPYYPLLAITLYTLYTNEYYSLEYMYYYTFFLYTHFIVIKELFNIQL